MADSIPNFSSLRDAMAWLQEELPKLLKERKIGFARSDEPFYTSDDPSEEAIFTANGKPFRVQSVFLQEVKIDENRGALRGRNFDRED